MGYQESWVYIEPQWNFKNLIRAYEQAEAAGYYKLFGAEPLSVIILKRSFGKIPAPFCHFCHSVSQKITVFNIFLILFPYRTNTSFHREFVGFF